MASPRVWCALQVEILNLFIQIQHYIVYHRKLTQWTDHFSTRVLNFYRFKQIYEKTKTALTFNVCVKRAKTIENKIPSSQSKKKRSNHAILENLSLVSVDF
jgi:hypothetical protein